MTDETALVAVVVGYFAIGVSVLVYMLRADEDWNEGTEFGPMDQFVFIAFIVLAWPLAVSCWLEE